MARAVLRWMEAKGFKRHEHPPQSPDLDQIAKAWAYLKSVVVNKASKLKSEQTSYAAPQKAWKELHITVHKRFVLELPDVGGVHAKPSVHSQT
jgi:transposase